MTILDLCREKTFWILLLMMVCAGASEQAVSQWASTFAEKGLGVSKAVGDLAGPMAFAILMGSARAFYGKFGDKIDLDKFMVGSGLLCIGSYLLISLSPLPQLSLLGCAICGLSVGIMWPGSFSKASAVMRNGGTAMFALLALGGDLGCSGGSDIGRLCIQHVFRRSEKRNTCSDCFSGVTDCRNSVVREETGSEIKNNEK